MTSKRESVIRELVSILEARNTFEVQRNTAVPVQPTKKGLVVVRDGDPGDPDVTMSPLEYHYEHPILVELFIAGGDLDESLDSLLVDFGQTLEANKTLNNSVDTSYLTAPNFDLTVDSGVHCKAASLNVVVFYSTYSPLN